MATNRKTQKCSTSAASNSCDRAAPSLFPSDLVLIPRRRAYRMLGLSLSAGFRREHGGDPDFPRAVELGAGRGRFGFRVDEFNKYVANLPRYKPDAKRLADSARAVRAKAKVREGAK